LIQRAVLAAIISYAPVAKAAEHGVTTALEMASYCKPVAEAPRVGEGLLLDNTRETGECWGFFGAVQQAAKITFHGASAPALYICAPPESSLVQMVLIFRRYVEVNPSEAHKTAFHVALIALQEAFPCKG